MAQNNRSGLDLHFKEVQTDIIFGATSPGKQFAIERESELRKELDLLVLIQPDRIRAASLLKKKEQTHKNTV
jgi:hypothetical protein